MSGFVELFCIVLAVVCAIALVELGFKTHFEDCERERRWSEARCRDRGWISDHT